MKEVDLLCQLQYHLRQDTSDRFIADEVLQLEKTHSFFMVIAE